MKICVYAIAKNERAFVNRWVESAKEADYIVVADTGSTDGTPELLKNLGVVVENITLPVWRFDHAREASRALIPEDTEVCICLDLDEILLPGWRQIIEAHWIEGQTNRLHYNYIWNFDDSGKPLKTYTAEKIHGRTSHKWVNAVHEILYSLEPEVHVWIPDITLIEHHADNSKSRGQYLPLLELDVKENPDNDRNAHYLGREYFYYARHDEAITELQRHLSLPSAQWAAERCASMRYIAKCYVAKHELDNAYNWYYKAIAEDPQSREAKVDLAQLLLANNNFYGAIYFATLALQTLPAGAIYLSETFAQNEGPYDILSVSHYWLGNYQLALENAEQAIVKNPHDLRLYDNLRYAKDALVHVRSPAI